MDLLHKNKKKIFFRDFTCIKRGSLRMLKTFCEFCLQDLPIKQFQGDVSCELLESPLYSTRFFGYVARIVYTSVSLRQIIKT